VRHAPDFFARRTDGSGLVIDVRADDRIEPGDAAKFAATARACALAGWEYLRTGALDPVLAANLRWLSGYRHPRYAAVPLARDLAGIFERPRALMEGARAAGHPVAVLPVLFGLLWRRALLADLASEPLDSRSVVWSPGPGGDGLQAWRAAGRCRDPAWRPGARGRQGHRDDGAAGGCRRGGQRGPAGCGAG
jgi:hypothetical protein